MHATRTAQQLRDDVAACAAAVQRNMDETYVLARPRVAGADDATQCVTMTATTTRNSGSNNDDGANAVDALWLLSLLQDKPELLQTVSQLYMQFATQYAHASMSSSSAAAAASPPTTAAQLRAQMQLVLAMSVPDAVRASSSSSSNSGGGSSTRAMLRTAMAAAMTMTTAPAVPLTHNVSCFVLQAPTTTTAVSATTTTMAAARTQQRGGNSSSGYALLLQRRQRPQQPSSCGVVVRTVQLPWPATVAARRQQQQHNNNNGNGNSSSSALPAIVFDVSPLSLLPACLRSCTLTHDDAHVTSGAHTSSPSMAIGRNSSSSNGDVDKSALTAAAIEQHIRRLACGRHGMLVLVGSAAAATALLRTQFAVCPELFLSSDGTNDDDDDDDEDEMRVTFAELPGCDAALRVLFTTRLWGAHIVVLLSPPHAQASSQQQQGDDDDEDNTRRQQQQQQQQRLLCDVLRLAALWNVDMLSVAVLPHADGSAVAAMTPADVSMQLLCQLQQAVALSSHGDTGYVQQGHKASTAATAAAPRPLHAIGAQQQSVVADGSSNAGKRKAAAAATTTTSAPVLFCTSMAIRVFLPLPACALAASPRDDHDNNSSSSSSTGNSNRSAGRGDASSAHTADTEDSGSDTVTLHALLARTFAGAATLL